MSGQVIKVGDTASDMKEGKNAGVFTIGVLEGSSALGLSEEEFTSLSAGGESRTDAAIRKKNSHAAGADLVIRDLSELPEIIEKGVFII